VSSFTVASHLVCDVGESGTTSNPNVGDKLRRYSGEVRIVASPLGGLGVLCVDAVGARG
jgi:hypothetical protein